MTEPRASPALRALAIVNPVAPNLDFEKLSQALGDAFERPGGHLRVFETSNAEDLADRLDREIARARSDGYDLVIVAGGDGTVSQVADALWRSHDAKPDLTLAIVPLGTANVLARELGIPLDPIAAVSVAAERRRVLEIDAIGRGDEVFLTQVGIGLDARMIAETSREAQIRHGRLAYLVALFRKIAGHHSERFVIEVDGRRLRVRAWQVVVANAGTFGQPPFTWGPDIEVGDGVLDLCIYDVRRIRDTIRLAWTVFTNRHGGAESSRYVPVRREVRITSVRPLPVQGDGELIGETPITLRVVPHALRVVLPELPPAEPAATEVKTAAPAQSPGADPTVAEERTPSPPADTAAEMAARPAEARQRGRLQVAQHVLIHGVKTFGAIDAGLFLKVNGIRGGRAFDLVMAGASRLMDIGEMWVALACVAGLTAPATHGRVPVEVIAPLWLAMLTVNFPIKSFFQRPRPFVAYVKARVVGGKPSDSSFPSGHTAAAFAGAALLAIHFPALTPVFYAYAVVVGFSRVYLGVHYPSDVGIGALVGTVLALFYRGVIVAWLTRP